MDVKRLRRRGFESAARDAGVLARHNRRYSLELPFGGIENQEQSGNCWLFAPVVLARAAALKRGSITGTESFSETYLYFFNLLEQASATLDDVRRIAERKESLDGDTLRQGLSQEVMGLADGGEWEWAFNLIEKYGLVPSHRMPETASSKATRALGVDLHERFARAARAIRKKPKSYAAIREQALRDVVRILVAHLGTPPPHVKLRGADAAAHGVRRADRLPRQRMAGGDQQSAAALPSGVRAAGERHHHRRAALQPPPPQRPPEAAAGAGARVAREAGTRWASRRTWTATTSTTCRGIMHPGVFNRARVYGARLIRDLPRREDIYLGVASSKHAMAIAGLDAARRGSSPIKYRVVNSWGPDMGDHGIYHMYAEWFEENVFKLAVHESVLDARERAAYDRPESVPGGNFY